MGETRPYSSVGGLGLHLASAPLASLLPLWLIPLIRLRDPGSMTWRGHSARRLLTTEHETQFGSLPVDGIVTSVMR